MVGIPTAVALTATLAFRGFSFWLPMLPGFWFSRHVLPRPAAEPHRTLGAYWALEPAALLQQLDATDGGLSSAEAAARLRRFGRNELKEGQRLSRVLVLWKQLRSPLLLLLLFAAVVSAVSGEWTDA